MLVTLVYPEKDQTIQLHVQGDLTLENFHGLCVLELGLQPDQIALFHNGKLLSNDHNTLASFHIQDNDLILAQSVPNRNLPPGMPRIDFGAIRMPGQASTSSHQPHSIPQSDLDINNSPEALRQRFLNSPHDLAILKERNPTFADAIIKGGEAFTKQLEKMRELQAQLQRDKIRMLTADPLDPEIQNKIAEEIRQKNIQENMNMAIEEAPESFGQVIMLWINVKVNGHSVKAFVDSGAQMTIMSAKCAESCNIMRLVDRRWEGIAKGVGTQKIIGRIHLAQMQIENDFLQCSFSVLENQPMDVLLGLDMLRRHQCCIDLKVNKLRIGTTGTETRFLHESELPLHNRLHDPSAINDQGAMSIEDELTERTIRESSEEAQRQEQASSGNVAGFPGTGGTLGATGSSGPQTGDSKTTLPESDIKKLTEMGFSRKVAEEELTKSNGDVESAVIKLLARSLKLP